MNYEALILPGVIAALGVLYYLAERYKADKAAQAVQQQPLSPGQPAITTSHLLQTTAMMSTIAGRIEDLHIKLDEHLKKETDHGLAQR